MSYLRYIAQLRTIQTAIVRCLSGRTCPAFRLQAHVSLPSHHTLAIIQCSYYFSSLFMACYGSDTTTQLVAILFQNDLISLQYARGLLRQHSSSSSSSSSSSTSSSSCSCCDFLTTSWSCNSHVALLTDSLIHANGTTHRNELQLARV